jgi:hypothetical protein
MSDAHPHGQKGPFQPVQGRRRAHRPIDLTKPPTAEELAEQPHDGEDRDRFSLWTPEQVEAETLNVRLDISFKDVARVRDQMTMMIECAQIIIRKTREHRLGSIQQRVEARRELDSLRRALARVNGRKPRTNT